MVAQGRRSLTIRVPMAPASCLLPNAQRRLSHHAWGPEAAKLRDAACEAAVLNRAAHGWHLSDGPATTAPVRIAAVIAWPAGRNRCDFQAAVHALKPAVDGLEDALIVANDRQVVGMDVRQVRAERDDPDGWIELTLEVCD